MEVVLPALSDDTRDGVRQYIATMQSKEYDIFEITVMAVTTEEALIKIERCAPSNSALLDIVIVDQYGNRFGG